MYYAEMDTSKITPSQRENDVKIIHWAMNQFQDWSLHDITGGYNALRPCNSTFLTSWTWYGELLELVDNDPMRLHGLFFRAFSRLLDERLDKIFKEQESPDPIQMQVRVKLPKTRMEEVAEKGLDVNLKIIFYDT